MRGHPKDNEECHFSFQSLYLIKIDGRHWTIDNGVIKVPGVS